MVVWKPERDIMTNKLISPSKADRQMERGRVCNLQPYILLTVRQQLVCRGQQSLTGEQLPVPLLPSDSPRWQQSTLCHAGDTAVAAVTHTLFFETRCLRCTERSTWCWNQGGAGGGGSAEEPFVPYIPRGSCSTGFKERGSSSPHLHLCEIDGT